MGEVHSDWTHLVSIFCFIGAVHHGALVLSLG